MDKDEASRVLSDEMEAYKRCTYQELLEMVEQTKHHERLSHSGTPYEVDVEILWDEKRKGTIRVVGIVDDGHLVSSMFPLSSDFIMNPDGSIAR